MKRLTEKERNNDGTAISKENVVSKGMVTDYCSKIITKLADFEDLEEQGLLLKLKREAKAELIEQHNKAFNLMNTIPLKGNEELFGYVGGVMQTLGYLIGELDKEESED